MPYTPDIHHRKSIRLKGYDYSQAGLYFITICTQNRKWLFGEIKDGEMILNDAGEMVKHWYYELNNKFNDIKCHAMVVMPNHFHCIIENTGSPVGADLCVCPIADAPIPSENIPGKNDPGKNVQGEHVIRGEHAIQGEHPIHGEHTIRGEHAIRGEHVGSPLRAIIQWFKTMTTNNYIREVKQNDWPPFHGKLWQRNYWEHIIRNLNEYQRITQYIINNPRQWENDRLTSRTDPRNCKDTSM